MAVSWFRRLAGLIAVRIPEQHCDEAPIRHLQSLDKPLCLSIPGGKTRYRVGLTDAQPALRGAGQALLAQRSSSSGLKDPNGLAAVLVCHLEVQHGVGIDPLHLFERSRKFNRFVEVVFRSDRMMRN